MLDKYYVSNVVERCRCLNSETDHGASDDDDDDDDESGGGDDEDCVNHAMGKGRIGKNMKRRS